MEFKKVVIKAFIEGFKEDKKEVLNKIKSLQPILYEELMDDLNEIEPIFDTPTQCEPNERFWFNPDDHEEGWGRTAY